MGTFKIGDLVALKWEPDLVRPEEKRMLREQERMITAFRVVEIMTIQCYGGTQVFYRCRLYGLTGDGGKQPPLFEYSEPELDTFYNVLKLSMEPEKVRDEN